MRCVTILVVSFVAVFPAYSTCLVKDSLFSAAAVFFASLIVEILIARDFRKHKLIFLFVSTLAMELLRHNGVYIAIGVVLCVCVLVLTYKSKISVLLIPLILTTVFYGVVNIVVIPQAGVPQGRAKEALSLPFQQTARYVKEHNQEITIEEQNAIDGVLDYSLLAERYNPELSDPVKSLFKNNPEKLSAYLGVWVYQGMRHPETYLMATFENTYGFFYPFFSKGAAYDSVLYDGLNHDTEAGDISLFHEIAFLAPARDFIHSYEKLSICLPPTMLFCNIGFVVQIFLYIFLRQVALAFSSKKTRTRRQINRCSLIAFIPSLVTFLVCILAPTFSFNGARYALPIVFLNPFLIALALWGFCSRCGVNEIEENSR